LGNEKQNVLCKLSLLYKKNYCGEERMKRDEKQQLRKMTFHQLMSEMEQLKTERIKLELKMLRTGTSTLVKNYPVQSGTEWEGNLKETKKRMAFINQLLQRKTQ
jgi:hypothetical protein